MIMQMFCIILHNDGGRKRDASEPSEGPRRLLHNEIAIMQTVCKIMQNIMQKVVPLPHKLPVAQVGSDTARRRAAGLRGVARPSRRSN